MNSAAFPFLTFESIKTLYVFYLDLSLEPFGLCHRLLSIYFSAFF